MYGDEKSDRVFPDRGLLADQGFALGGCKVYPIHTTGTRNHINRAEAATGAVCLLPGSDLKIPMGQRMGQTRPIHGWMCNAQLGKHCLSAVLIQVLPTKAWAQVLEETEKSRPRWGSQPNTAHFIETNVLTNVGSTGREGRSDDYK